MTRKPRSRPGRSLGWFLLVVLAFYALVFFTGDRTPAAKLGIDLRGGTRVTLTARTPDGGRPSRASLDQARQIIQTRVNGIGVGGTQVILDADNIVITVPGEQGDQAKNLGKTARLGFRKVVAAYDAATPVPPPPAGGGAPGAAPAQPPVTPPVDGSLDAKTAKEVQDAKAVRQNPVLLPSNQADQEVLQRALSSLNCRPGAYDPLVGNDDPARPLVTCDEKGTEKFLLEPEFLRGTEVGDATSGYNSQAGGQTVNLSFTAAGTKTWGEFTSANVNQRAAFVLDTRVVSAPGITSAILDGKTEIRGKFTPAEAKSLADILKYGSLPLSFTSSDATTVSATLGLASLQAGLTAGGIGLLVVFVYCLFYYRLLGVLTILSLALSGTLIYAVLVLLGRWIGYTLDLAGIAGLIIAIGITADSFVIFFERLKDEIRVGRTLRSAVSRGWVRARRTILASDAVSFLAAAILYVLAIGDVQGFAFTLGMSTVLDLVVVCLVTHPVVALVSDAGSTFLSAPRNLGLGAVQRLGSHTAFRSP
ncbi:protein translocase subunit SecD [Amycolatopsis sp. H20-H5]|uniref:protein translocase subunit SecD n=1 Tax=Amycolatopsis sp. H20-H5 TaxID=3046309 RepID=UPI002DBEBE14|nr:protein translocase subunit SecD [Amycolatopsis sp. H20-H5]MEC3979024.1 protein translocase subunit SecD [Amycolatopsis sp. H20-H5]